MTTTHCRILKLLQQEKALFNNSVYHSIMLTHWFGPRGIARLYPHKFEHFPIPSMALTAADIEIILGSFDPNSGVFTAVKLNDDHRSMIYNKWVVKLQWLHDNMYHCYFLNQNQKAVSNRGL
jgi:hypothetical protein